MSRLSQLPPRFPVRNGGVSTQTVNPISPKGDELARQHHSFPSQGSFYEEQLSWLGDLLDDCGTSIKVSPLRRAISDPATIMEGSSMFDFTAFPVDDGVTVSSDDYCKTVNIGDKNDASDGLESCCVYGPNSPRRMDNSLQPESSIVSQILESAICNPFHYVSVSIPSSDASESNVKGDNHAAFDNFDSEQPARRHTGQRSRVRKLQYIAELEKTVNVFQALEAELAAKVASLFQQRAVLSLENTSLKQKIAGLRKEKMLKDGQYQSLKNEVKKLKTNCARHAKGKGVSWFPQDNVGSDYSETNWQMLDIGKLNLGENPTPLRHGFRS